MDVEKRGWRMPVFIAWGLVGTIVGSLACLALLVYINKNTTWVMFSDEAMAPQERCMGGSPVSEGYIFALFLPLLLLAVSLGVAGGIFKKGARLRSRLASISLVVVAVVVGMVCFFYCSLMVLDDISHAMD